MLVNIFLVLLAKRTCFTQKNISRVAVNWKNKKSISVSADLFFLEVLSTLLLTSGERAGSDPGEKPHSYTAGEPGTRSQPAAGMRNAALPARWLR